MEEELMKKNGTATDLETKEEGRQIYISLA